MHKQKIFYTPFWQKDVPFDCENIISHVRKYQKHRFDMDIPEDKFFFDGTKKGFTTRMLTLSDTTDASKQKYGPDSTVVYDPTIHMLCDMITYHVNQFVDDSVDLIDFQFYVIHKGNYQKLINNETDTKYIAHYTLQVDDVYDNGEYRFMNPNTLATPLYHSAPVREQQLMIWQSSMLYEMLTYQGENDRITLLLNYGNKS